MADFRTVLERFRTDLISRDAKIDDWKVSSIGVYLLLNAHLCCIVQNEKKHDKTEIKSRSMDSCSATDGTDLCLVRGWS